MAHARGDLHAALRRRGLDAEGHRLPSICTALARPATIDSESQAVTWRIGAARPRSSTKGRDGHTLGAAAALEAVMSAITSERFNARRGHTTHIGGPNAHRAPTEGKTAIAGVLCI